VVDFKSQQAGAAPRFLFIGGGGYTYPRALEVTYPNSTIEVIEIDPGVTRIAHEELGLAADTRIRTFNEDGRQRIDAMIASGVSGQYDFVFGDAFNDLSIPYHLTTREFDERIRTLLTPDGIYLSNIIDKLWPSDNGLGAQFITSYVRTIQEVFPHVYILAAGDPWDSHFQNTYIVAASQSPIDPAALQAFLAQRQNGEHARTTMMPEEQMAGWLKTFTDRSVILTDDYAPADQLVAPLFVERGG